MLKVIICDTLRSRQNREVKFGIKLEKRMLLNFPKKNHFLSYLHTLQLKKKPLKLFQNYSNIFFLPNF